ncbi:TMEM175 family protein [Lacticaseibacillus nasuensis]|uniref:TMEM175 family protein n=1 Tax=Lacticaseibacillus nasuensis TaxID=944671 RepID=UPI0022464A84|nr:TMEM175 family protein [Lacticaseibacillus nasuensis]MCX2454549.1 TMEM175 family protein [Lacticaseibacillus nasuensis]
MPKNRLEAFTDGVVAIIITIMVLELTPPAGSSFTALWGLRDKFLIYLVSFVILAVYWNNHHHLLQLAKHIDGVVLWANVFFLFALSLFPFATAWIGEHLGTAVAPAVFYGAVMTLGNLAYYLLLLALIHANGRASAIQQTLGQDYYKPLVSIGGALVSTALAWVWPPIVVILNTGLLLLWVLPERRVERHINHRQ